MGRMWEVPQTSLESRGLPDLVTELREHGLEVRPGKLRERAPRHHVPAHPRGGVRGAPGQPAAGRSERYVWARPAEIGALPVSSSPARSSDPQAPQLPLQLE